MNLPAPTLSSPCPACGSRAAKRIVVTPLPYRSSNNGWLAVLGCAFPPVWIVMLIMLIVQAMKPKPPLGAAPRSLQCVTCGHTTPGHTTPS